LRLLSHAASGVKPGGVLLYATCSLFARENEDVVKAFLAQTPKFAPEHFQNPLTQEPAGSMLRIWPWDGDCDAMFVAKFRRTDSRG
jgi:16S rRNA (cytosine967-C5)-methyltransferase